MKVITIESETTVAFGPVCQRPKRQEAVARYAEIAEYLRSNFPPPPHHASDFAQVHRPDSAHLCGQPTPFEVAGPYLISTNEVPIQ